MTKLLDLPYLKVNIPQNLYDKKDIIDTIENNYTKSTNRNTWEGDIFNPSNLHHSLEDDQNNNFEKVNYQSLLPVYNDVIDHFIKKINLVNSIKFNWEIVNYTICGESQYMNYHDHIAHCDFFMVHYIQFDKNNHKPTLYKNTHCFSDYMLHLRPEMFNSFTDNLENSWLRKEFYIEVDEDDAVIVPAALPHMIPPNKKGNKNRITLVTNIEIHQQ